MAIFSKIFLTAIISSVGAFIPVFIVMYIHYRIRKDFYNKIKPSIKRDLYFEKKEQKIYSDSLDRIYKGWGVKDELELIDKGIISKISEGVMDLINDYINKKNDSDIRILKKENDLNFIRNYNFRRYLIGLLNDKFPENYFKNR